MASRERSLSERPPAPWSLFGGTGEVTVQASSCLSTGRSFSPVSCVLGWFFLLDARLGQDTESGSLLE